MITQGDQSNFCLISVIIPAYNVSEYILDSVNSLLEQRIDSFEIVIVDDGSTDDTLNIVKKAYQDNAKVRIYSQENQGAGAARNKGIALSRGEYIFCCDPDDIVVSNLFEEFLCRYQQNKDIDIFCFSSEQFYEDGKRVGKVTHTKSGWYKGYEVLCEMIFRGDYTSAAWTYILKKQLICDNQLNFKGRVHEDHIYTARGYLLSKTAYVTEHSYYLQRSRKGSLTNSKKSERYIHDRFNALTSVLQLFHEEFPKNAYFEELKKKYTRNTLLSIANICAENYYILPKKLKAKFMDYSNCNLANFKDILIFRFPRVLVFIKNFHR